MVSAATAKSVFDCQRQRLTLGRIIGGGQHNRPHEFGCRCTLGRVVGSYLHFLERKDYLVEIFNCDPQAEYLTISRVGVDCVFSEFMDSAVTARDLSNGKQSLTKYPARKFGLAMGHVQKSNRVDVIY